LNLSEISLTLRAHQTLPFSLIFDTRESETTPCAFRQCLRR
jgi:hypothetical protein